MMDWTPLTGGSNYFEDFEPGLVIRHARGKTVTALENVMFTNLVMNTAEGHFNEDLMSRHPAGKVVVYGGINFSMILGLSTQDCCENAVAELRLDNIKLSKPVLHGDTLYAVSEVLSSEPDVDGGTGVVHFRHYGYNQREELVVMVDRVARIKRRPG